MCIRSHRWDLKSHLLCYWLSYHDFLKCYCSHKQNNYIWRSDANISRTPHIIYTYINIQHINIAAGLTQHEQHSTQPCTSIISYIIRSMSQCACLSQRQNMTVTGQEVGVHFHSSAVNLWSWLHIWDLSVGASALRDCNTVKSHLVK